MTKENEAMNSTYGLEFLNLDDATEDQKQEIHGILHRDNECASVEFPWGSAILFKPHSPEPVTLVDHYEGEQLNYAAVLTTCGNQIFSPPEDMSYHGTAVLAPQDPHCHPVVCLSHGGSVAHVPPMQGAVPLFALQDLSVQRSILPMSSDSELYNVSAVSKPLGPAYSNNKNENADKVHHRRNKKKRPPEYFEKYNHRDSLDYNIILDEQAVPSLQQAPPHLTALSVPVSLSTTDPQNVSPSAPVPFTCMAGPIQGPNGTTMQHPYPAVPSFYTCASPVIYPGGIYMMPPHNVYSPPYPNYPNPHGNYAHIVVPTEAAVASEMSSTNHLMDPVIVSDVGGVETVPSQVPNKTFAQEKVMLQTETELELPSTTTTAMTMPMPPRETCPSPKVNLNVASPSLDNNKQKNSSASTNGPVNKNIVEKNANSLGDSNDDGTHSSDSSNSKSCESERSKEQLKGDCADISNSNDASVTKTWASLFKPNTVNVNSMSSQPTLDDRTRQKKSDLTEENVFPEKKDTVPVGLREMLSTIQLDHHSVHFVPRGLSNKGNWCYINATLQALLACPPFYNLMKKLPVVPGLKKGNSSMPAIDAIVEFVHEFVSGENMPKNNVKNSLNKINEEIMIGEPFEPTYIFDMLKRIKSDTFTKGRQEDAEEFLTWILNKVHEEMVALKSSSSDDKLKNGTSAPNGDIINHLNDDNTDENEWLIIDHKNKGCTTRSIPCNPSPIQDIFGGQMCSMLQRAGSSKSKTLQPFFTLQLDIQAENVTCIKSALEGLVMKESLQGYTCSNTNQEVEASQRITLEKLPTVLILHLKRFVFDRNGGCQKLLKRIDFDFSLELSKELLSSSARTAERSRTYQLFAVVYHDGQEAAKGHYITDVFHSGNKCWLRADDAKVKSIANDSVLKYDPPRVPYLLYYRRGDTIS